MNEGEARDERRWPRGPDLQSRFGAGHQNIAAVQQEVDGLVIPHVL